MARILDGIIGHQELIKNLLQKNEIGRFPSSLMLVGPQGVGRKLTAMGLAQALMCERKPSACGECGSCLRIAKGQSEGLLTIESEKNQIKIEQTRKIAEFLHLRILGKARVIIIDDAHLMNPQAANALLKNLEEPTPSTYFMLIAPSRRHVLTTIASRCQIASFGALSVEELRRKHNVADWLLKASRGSFAALQDLQSSEEEELREHAAQLLGQWLNEPQSFLVGEWRTVIKDRTLAQTMTKYIAIYLRDAILHQQGGEILSPDKKSLIHDLAKIPQETLMDMAWSCIRMEQGLRSNRDSTMVFEEFWLKAL
jgi:DNA polymerase-3 subunit delta'